MTSATADDSPTAPTRTAHARRVRLVLFDLYETLVRFDLPSIASAREHMQFCFTSEILECVRDVTLENRMRGHLGSTLDVELCTILSKEGARFTQRHVTELREAELRAWRDATRVYEDVVPCLQRLSEAQIPMGLISNCSPLTRPLLDGWHFSKYFQLATLSCEVGSIKPERAIFESALAGIGHPWSEVVLVDDTPQYVQFARGLGLQAYLIDRGHRSGSTATGVIRDLRDLPAFLGVRDVPASPVANRSIG